MGAAWERHGMSELAFILPSHQLSDFCALTNRTKLYPEVQNNPK
jgi:hypothetical protein